MKLVALQRDKEIRAHFVSDASIYKPEMLELTGVTASKYGYSPRGRPVQSEKPLVREECISAIAFMLVYGFLDCHTVMGTVNADVFQECVS